MGEPEDEEQPKDLLPIFSPAFRRLWELILPRTPMRYYIPERESEEEDA